MPIQESPTASATGPISVSGVGRDLHRGATTALAQDPLGLVHGHRHEPGAEVGRVPDVAQPLPRDQPRGLCCLLSDGGVPRHRETDAPHVLVVGRDQMAEGDLVTGNRSSEQIRSPPALPFVSQLPYPM